MSRAALLLVVGEAYNDKQKTLILDKIAEDLQSWDDDGARCDLEKELEDFAAEMKSFGDVAVSGTALSHNSGNLSISILFSPDRKLLHDSLQNFLLHDSHYRHLVYAGQTFAGSGSWVLPDDVFTFRNFVKVLKEMDSVGVGGDGKGFALNVSSTPEWDWNKSNFTRLSNLGVKLAAAGGLSENGRNFSSFQAFLDPLVAVIDVKELLPASSTVGMINFSGPTLYIFPGGNGSSALFGVKGFTGLVDGGYSRKSCSWHFSRHLHQIDMVILSHLGASNFLGMQSFLERKIETGSPDVGSVFFNCPEKFRKLSPNPESLKVNLFDAGAALSEKLTSVGLQPQSCFTPQPYQPITLYNKVGFGSVDMYVLNPVQNSEEMKTFLHQWSMRAESESFSGHSGVPLSNALSVSVLLVWKPFNPSAKIIRILFPGGTPQGKIFEGLDRLKNIPVFERSECSQAELAKPMRAAQSRPTTLKPTAVKVNGNLDHIKETAKAKPMNGSKDSVAGKAKADAREPIPMLVKASAIQRTTKVEPKKPEKTDISPTTGTSTPKADSKSTTKPASPSKTVKDTKTTSSRNTENLPPKRLAQKPSEAEASPKKTAAKPSQPEAMKQTKPARRTDEVKAPEMVKQTAASKPLNIAKEPAAKQLNSTKDTRAARHSEPMKQTKASSVTETAKHGTPKPIKATKESDKKVPKQAEPKQAESKKPKQPESEKKDLEKEVKEEVALIQPAEEVKRTVTPENVVSEPVCVAATAVEQTTAILPEVGLIVADAVLGDVEAATRAVDYDLPSPEDVAQMSQEDEDSFVEELPTEMEPGYGDQKDKESGIVPAADPDLIVNHETRDDVMPHDRDVQAVHDFDQDDKVSHENEVEGNKDLVYSRGIPENLKSGEFANDFDVTSQEIVDDKIDAELEEDLEFERAEEAVQNLDDSLEDGNVEEVKESAQPSYAQHPDVFRDHDISGVSELVTEENVERVDHGKEKEDREDLISHDHKDVVHNTAAVDRDSAHDQDVLEEQVVAEGNDMEKEDMVKDEDLEEQRDLEREHAEKDLLEDHHDRDEDHDLEEHYDLEPEHRLEKEHAEKDLLEDHDHDEDHDMEDRDFEREHHLGKLHVEKLLLEDQDHDEDHDVEEDRDLEKQHHLEKEHAEKHLSEGHDRDEDHDMEKLRDLEREHHLEVDHAEKDLSQDRDKDCAMEKDHDVEKHEEPNSWLLQDSRSSLEPSAFQVKRATDGLARYCEEFGSDEGEAAEEQHGRDELKEDRVTCPGGIQVPAKRVDAKEEEEEDEVDELEAVEEEEEMEEEEGARIRVEHRTVPEIGCEVDVVLSEDMANGGHLPDVLGGEQLVEKEDVELVGSLKAETTESSPSPVPHVQVDRSDELGTDEGFDREEDFGGVEQDLGRGDDFDKVGDFGVKDEDYGKGEEDFGRAERDLGRGDDFDKVGAFGRREEDVYSDEDLMSDEEAGRAEEEMIAELKRKDDDDSDVDLSETKEGVVAGEGSGGSLSDNEAEEAEPGVRPLELVDDDDVLPCALKKDTAIENLAAICAETKEDSSETVTSLSSRELMLGEGQPDLVAACEASEPQDVETGFEREEEDRGSMEGPDGIKAEGVDGYRFETEQPHNLSLDEGISQGKPHDLHLFNSEDQEEQPSSCSWKLDDMAANLAHEVIQSSLAAQNLDASGCFASGPVSVTPMNGTEKPEIEAHESTPETLKDVTSLVNAMVDTVATSDSTSSGRFNYGFDDERREDAFAAHSLDGASAVVQPPQFKSGEDSGESDLDEGLDACQGQRGLELGNELEDGSRFDEGFEELTGDESQANVAELLPQRVENKTAESLSRAEDSEGPCGFAYGASGEVANELEEPFGSAGGPSSEKTVDNSRPLLDFDSDDVSATHQMEFGNGCVEAQQNATNAWQRNNPFLDPCSAEAEEKGNVEQDLMGDGETRISSGAGYFQSMTASGVDREEFDHKLEGDEQSIPSDDNAEPVIPSGHEQDMVQSADERGSDEQKETPEDETAEISARVEGVSPEANVTKSQVVEETSENRRTASFWSYDDNVQSTESATVHGAADNILFSEETTNDAQRDINENLGIATGPEEADEELAEDFEKVSTHSNVSDEGESRSSALLSEQHEGPESLDSDVEVDPVKSWGQPMGLPAPAQDSNRNKVKTASRLNNDAANLTLPVSTHDKKPPAKSNDRSFVAPQKKASDIRRSVALKTTANPTESKQNGSFVKDTKTTVAKKPVTSAAPVAKKLTTTSTDTSKSKPLKHVVPFYVDLTYIPGNGDPAYVDTDFFRRVRARYYVLSSLDPDPHFLSCLVEGKQTWENKDLSVNVIPTHDSSALHRWFHENAKLVEELKISLLPAANKCTIKLQDKDDGCYAFRIEF